MYKIYRGLAVASSSEANLARLQAELASELERTRLRDGVLALIVAALFTGVLWFMFGRPCLRAEAFLGHVWCTQVGPWSYARLGWLALLNFAGTAPLTFNQLRRRRRRRFWAF